MANQPIVPGPEKRDQQAAWNAQAPLVLAVVPSGASQGLVGTYLVDAGALTVAGVYRCLIPLSGLVTELEVHLTATIAASTASSDLDTLYWVRTPGDPTTWSKKTAGTGDGALTTTVLQTSAITDLAGEQYAVMDITLGATPNVTFTRAEYNGK